MMKWILRIILAGLVLLAWMFRSAHSEHKETAVIRLLGDAEFSPFKLLFISDVHRRELRPDMFNDQVDLVVIGGGINGAGIARDAAGRGLSVIMCEKGDLAEGTSSRSGSSARTSCTRASAPSPVCSWAYEPISWPSGMTSRNR